TQRSIESDGIVQSGRCLDEGCDEVEGLSPHVEEAIPDEVELFRPRESFHRLERVRHGVGRGSEPLGELQGAGWVQMPLDPFDALERSEEWRKQVLDPAADLRRD